MISVTDLRAGVVFKDLGNIFQVLSYEHIKMGRGSANIKVKVKNVRTGTTIEKSFINGAKVNEISVLKKEMQFLYKDNDFAYFMDPTSFEQVNIPMQIIGDDYFYLMTGKNYSLSFIENKALSINLPPKIEFVVKEAAPSLRGNSATNIYKDAILENGLKARVPLFIKAGDKIKIDTRTGQYSQKS